VPEEKKELSSIIYGPVPSWRLGRSLGVDLLSTAGKVCCFDCIYCQLGRTTHRTITRREFVSLGEVSPELRTAQGVAADWVTFSGMGEPTLASNLGQAIELARETLGLPIAVLTNSALMVRAEVRQELAKADLIVAKLDAPNEQLFRRINRPIRQISLAEVLKGIKLFKAEHQRRLALQLMFVDENRDHAREMAQLAREVSPDEVQLNTPLRPCPVRPLSPEEMSRIKQEFDGLESLVVMVYEAPKPGVTPFDLKQTLRRRIKL